jgi:hypothetical protein
MGMWGDPANVIGSTGEFAPIAGAIGGAFAGYLAGLCGGRVAGVFTGAGFGLLENEYGT